ncbi:MAG: PilZ domain-containing protein [Phycisphaerales bacterium]|nr:MAG: PilZ domain-containing protein [Phycisphaerales bacterium]
MGVRTGQQDLSGCATKEELASLFDNAFATWQSGGPKPDDNRETPRIPGGEAKPLFVVSYTDNGQEVRLNRRAEIVDISADGLGVAVAEPLPVGAILQFAFDSQNGERNFGVATVVRLTKTEGGYRIGLTFAKDAKSLDVESSPDGAETHFEPTRRWHRPFDQLKKAVIAGYHVFTQRRLARQRAGKMR